MLYDDGFFIGQELVAHPLIEAVTFTGSQRGGKALMEIAARRERPIPCFCEMGSLNPVFLLSGALAEDPQAKAKGLYGSFTLGAGQFCTKPGMVFVPETEGMMRFRQELRTLTAASSSFQHADQRYRGCVPARGHVAGHAGGFEHQCSRGILSADRRCFV